MKRCVIYVRIKLSLVIRIQKLTVWTFWMAVYYTPTILKRKKKSYKLWNVIEECYMDRINGILNSWIQYWNVIVLSYFINLNWARNNSYWRDWFNKHEHNLWWKLGTCNTKHKANDTEKNALMNTENCEHIFKIQKDLDWIHTVELWVQILQINS